MYSSKVMIPTGVFIVLLLISSCLSQPKCSLSNVCYKATERVFNQYVKDVCVCPFAPCISSTNPCPGSENIKFDGISMATVLSAGIFKEWGTLNAISIQQGPPVNITKDLFKSQRPHLKILELISFSIERIEVKAFIGFLKLEILDIRPFKVNRIQRNTFRGLSTLRVLKLYSGNVKVVEPGAFNGLDNLKRLWLVNNKIEHIQRGVFDGLVKLEELRLSFNKIHRIDPFTFSQLSNIYSLECWDTNVRKLTPEILDGLQSISMLNFGRNTIKTIGTGTFSKMENLEHLDLSQNNLTTFSLIDLYLPLPSLMTLDLEYNQIEDILFPTQSREPLLTNLTMFVLNANQLRALPRFILDYAPVIISDYAPVPTSCECYKIANGTDPQQPSNFKVPVPSMTCPDTCTMPTVNCTPRTVMMKDLLEMPLITITCNVTGNPTPTVTWRRPNGGIVLGDYNPWEGVTNLYLSDVRISEIGHYACHVKNVAGVATSITAINLIDSACSTNLPNLVLLFIMIMLTVVQVNCFLLC